MWSIGIVMYILLTGKAPYFGNDDEKIIAQAKKGLINRNLLLECTNISKRALTLIDKLLVKDPKTRLSALEAIENPWIQKRQQLELINYNVQLGIMDNLISFNAKFKL